MPQLRSLSNQAAQAVGFYQAEFKFEKISETVSARISHTQCSSSNCEQNIEFSGPVRNQAQFQVIGVLPDQEEGDILNHGDYELTKSRINEAATNNGYFDSYWRLHDVKLRSHKILLILICALKRVSAINLVV